MNKLALGTVQFGLRYGVANTSGQVAPAAIAAILLRARQAGIDTLDTAIAYGDSETRLGDVGMESWRVVTKLPALPDGVADVFEWVESQVRGSLQRLKLARVDGLLLHKTSDCLGPHGATYVRALNELKARGWVRSAGISIYDPAELDALWPVWQPDIVQAPCNVLDRRLIQSGWLEKLRQAGVRLHIRSVFLQGLLLLPKARRPDSFSTWATLLDRWLDWCVEHEVTPPQAALGFILSLPGVERLVVGVDSGAQLDEILAATNAEVAVPPDDLCSRDRALIEPSRWKLA
jgi:aryl-alcohol dehydrogenase-like predicted oxidoreductase